MYIWYGAFSVYPAQLMKEDFIPGCLADTKLSGSLSCEWNGCISDSAVNKFCYKVLLRVQCTYIASIYPVILTLAASTNVNIMALSLMLAFFGGYGALLCNYGNGASIYIFGNGYVSQKDWYLKGTILLAMIFAVFLIIGLPYWKIMGIC